MVVVVTVVVWILVAVVAAIAVVVLVPIHLEAHGRLAGDEVGGAIEARWGWGLWGLEVGLGEPMALRVLGIRVYTASGRRERPEKARREKKPAKKRRPFVRSARDHGRAFLGMGRRLLGALGLRVTVEGVVGLEDPGDTAILMEVLRLARGRSRALELRLRGDYLDAALSLFCRVRARIWFAQLGAVALSLLARRENRQAIRAMLFR